MPKILEAEELFLLGVKLLLDDDAHVEELLELHYLIGGR